jgi:hypothetical protein
MEIPSRHTTVVIEDDITFKCLGNLPSLSHVHIVLSRERSPQRTCTHSVIFHSTPREPLLALSFSHQHLLTMVPPGNLPSLSHIHTVLSRERFPQGTSPCSVSPHSVIFTSASPLHSPPREPLCGQYADTHCLYMDSNPTAGLGLPYCEPHDGVRVSGRGLSTCATYHLLST